MVVGRSANHLLMCSSAVLAVGLLLGCSAPSEFLVILLSGNTNDSRWGESTVLFVDLSHSATIWCIVWYSVVLH